MLLFLRRHMLAIFFAILTGMITYLPQYLTISELKSDYKNIEVTGTDVEEYYLNRVREAYDGYYTIASPEHAEYKNFPYVQPGLGESALAKTAKIAGVTPAKMVSFGKFIFPALLFLVFYGIGYHFTHSRTVGLAAGTLILLGSNFVSSPQDIIKIFTFRAEDLKDFLPYTRPIHPQISSLIFYFWFFLLLRWLESRSKKYIFPLGVILGLMFYIYLYSWTLAYGILGILLIFGATMKKLQIPKLQIILMAFFGFILSIPYWMSFFALRASPYYPNLQKLYGFYVSREMLWSNLLFADFIILVIWYFKKKKDFVFTILLSIIIALALLINQQVVTGFRFYPGHWHWYYAIPFSILLAVIVFFYFLRSFFPSMFLYRIVGFFFIAIAIFNGFWKQHNAFYAIFDQTTNDQRYAEVFQWLNENSKKDDVVLSHDRLSMHVPTYTYNNNYFSNWSNLYLTPPERFRDMGFLLYYLDGVTPENAVEYLKKENRYSRILLYGYFKLRTGQCKNGCYTQEEIDRLAREYSEFYKKLDFEKQLKKYKVDYVLWDPAIRPQWNIDKIKIFSKITDINGVKIYKVL